MSVDKDTSGRRGQEDQERDRAVYRYLLTLTDLGIPEAEDSSRRSSDSKPNESYIAKQWGLEDNRIFVRRVLRSVLHDEYYPEEKNSSVPGLTLGKLVKILVALDQYWLNNRQITSGGKVPKVLTRSEKLRSLHIFWKLSLEERNELNLPLHPGEMLLQRLQEEATDPIKGISKENAVQLYSTFLNEYQTARTLAKAKLLPQQTPPKLTSKRSRSSSDQEDHTAFREAVIQTTINDVLNESYEGLDLKAKTEKTEELLKKVQREISRIEIQAGQEQFQSFLGKVSGTPPNQFITPEFVARLTRSVIENEILTDEFPVYLKYVDVEKVQPLPVFVKKEGQEFGLLNPEFLPEPEDEGTIGLEKQFAYKVRVYYYIKLPRGYEPQFKDDTKVDIRDQLNFLEQFTGIGSPISLVLAANNRVLLWDIPQLDAYLSTVKQVFANVETLGDAPNNPVWCHALVKLCKEEDVKRALRENDHYEIFDTNSELAYGDFCGFDLVETATKAFLHATLRAIKLTGVSPKNYLRELCIRVEQANALEKAKSFLNYYPFSLGAMEGYLNQTIFRDGKYRTRDESFKFREADPKRCERWSLVAYDAHLSLAEAYLREGLYRCAKQYLDVLEPHLKKYELVLGTLLNARYYLALSQYRLMADLGDQDYYPYSDRFQAIQDTLESLNKAEDWLKQRLKIFHAINELPQSNFHPFFYTASRIESLRARLYIYFSTYVGSGKTGNDTLREAVRYLEKARIYAAKDGIPANYAYQSAMQSWCYLMIAYLWDHQRDPSATFSKAECIDWARRLVEHALLCYASTGEQCYQQLKNNAGKAPHKYHQGKAYDTYGGTLVQVVPFIRELLGEGEPGKQQQGYQPKHSYVSQDVLELDLSIFKAVDHSNINRSRYLFGTDASILLFADGLLDLCEAQDSDSLKKKLDSAAKKFTAAWATAKDGSASRKEGSELIVDRLFNKSQSFDHSNISCIQGLYPHRLSRVADLGKIFMAVSQLLIILSCPDLEKFYQSKLSWEKFYQETKTDWKDIKELVADLHDQSELSIAAQASRQARYNGHLANHYEKIQRYFQQFESDLKERKIRFSSLVESRNKVIRDIFRLIRGESSVTPSSDT